MKLMYLVVLATGSHDDYTELPLFVTEDKDFAENWKKRYMNIIESNRERISNFDIYDHNKELPYCYYLIDEDPNIVIKEVGLKVNKNK